MGPMLERASGLVAGSDFHLAMSPERIDPGRTDYTVRTMPKIVGGLTPACTERAVALYAQGRRHARARLRARDGRAGEAAREHLPLGQHRAHERDGDALRPHGHRRLGGRRRGRHEAVRLHALHARPGPRRPLHPARPVLPLLARTRSSTSTPSSSSSRARSTRTCPTSAARRSPARSTASPSRCAARSVLVVGVAYKPDIDDTRESPALKLIELLRDEGCDVSYHDPYVRAAARVRARVRRARRRPIESSDCVVVVTNHSSIDYDDVVRARAARGRLPQRHRAAGTSQRQGRQAVSVRIGVVGLGYWGPNVVRNMARVAELALVLRPLRGEPRALRAAVPAGALHRRLRRPAERSVARRRRRGLERADAPPARPARPRGRQARLHREAAGCERRPTPASSSRPPSRPTAA